jgi:tripartite-type tricarboxylate transporter receptor subunit TctC
VSGSANAQDVYPSRNINVVVASAPGGITDMVARIMSQPLTDKLGQPLVIETRPGSAGNIAARLVSTMAADGYTVLVTTTSLAINETLYKDKGYVTQSLRPVGIVAFSPDVIAVNPSNPAKTLGEFLSKGKQKPPTYATAGVGTASHIGAEYLFREIAKISAVHVPFNGGAPAVSNVLGNHVESLVLAMPVVTPYLVDGRLRGLGLASATRSPAAPSVETYAEAGIRDFQSGTWVGFFVDVKTPDNVVLKLNELLNETVVLPTVKQRLSELGLQPVVRSQRETDAYFASEVANELSPNLGDGGIRRQRLELAI